MKGCGASGDNECDTNEYFETATMNCQLESIYLANAGSCYRAQGSIFMKPSQDYTTETGLQYIEYQYHNSGGPNADTTTYQLIFYGGNGYTFGQTQPTDEALSKNDKGTITFTIETVSTPPPVLAPNFTSYEGSWVAIAQDVSDYTYSSTMTYESDDTTEYENEFLEGLTMGAEAGFMGDKLSTSAQSTFTQTTTTTVENIDTASATTTCSAVDCENGRLYQWVVAGATNDDDTSTVSGCIYTCVDNSIPQGPVCPFGYCGDNECQCCNTVWIEGNDDPDANHLCSN